MPNIQAINHNDFLDKYWKKLEHYKFVAKDTFCSVTVQEIPKITMQMPFAISKSDIGMGLVALTGFRKDENLFINSDGKWTGPYLPAILRCYPFLLARTADDEDTLVFCIDSDSGVVTTDSDHEPFFDADGELSDRLKGVMKLLEALVADRVATETICKLLDEMQLIKPWEVSIQVGDTPYKIEGLYCIDEQVFNSLNDEQFLKLRNGSALPVIYCQMLSQQKISELARRAEIVSGTNSSYSLSDLGLDPFNDAGTINLDNI